MGQCPVHNLNLAVNAHQIILDSNISGLVCKPLLAHWLFLIMHADSCKPMRMLCLACHHSKVNQYIPPHITRNMRDCEHSLCQAIICHLHSTAHVFDKSSCMGSFVHDTIHCNGPYLLPACHQQFERALDV